VPGAISLHTLHKMLQVVMGWENTHLYLFRLTINEKTTMYVVNDLKDRTKILG
jgi:Plasmid pRiA4b ORF-3-like protein